MKLSKGSIWEFILGLFFIFSGFNTGEIVSCLIMVIGGGLVCWHCIHLWKKQGKNNKQKKDDE